MIEVEAVLDDGHRFVAELPIGSIHRVDVIDGAVVIKMYDGTRLRSTEKLDVILGKIEAEM